MNENDKQFQKVEWSGDQYSPADDDLDELPALPKRSLPPEDRALLELAALAIGCVRFEEVEGEEYANLHFIDGAVMHAWNPLMFSGDALELAVKLSFDVCTSAGIVCVGDARCVEWLAEEYLDAAPLAASRRAITRAAAEIGKQHVHA